jgi:hypothetical protein
MQKTIKIKSFTSFGVFVGERQTFAIHAFRFFANNFGRSIGLHSIKIPVQPFSSRAKEFDATSPSYAPASMNVPL